MPPPGHFLGGNEEAADAKRKTAINHGAPFLIERFQEYKLKPISGQGKLRAGRPVAVAMLLSRLKAWGLSAATDKNNRHAFLVVGRKGGIFKTVNSWGNAPPDLKDNELCRVYDVVGIKVPADKDYTAHRDAASGSRLETLYGSFRRILTRLRNSR